MEAGGTNPKSHTPIPQEQGYNKVVGALVASRGFVTPSEVTHGVTNTTPTPAFSAFFVLNQPNPTIFFSAMHLLRVFLFIGFLDLKKMAACVLLKDVNTIKYLQPRFGTLWLLPVPQTVGSPQVTLLSD